jgi:glycosyltransferase involved in cell wall biosynthesis
MRILWVKAGGLWPLTSGGRIRSFHTIRELSKRHEVSVITTHAPGDDVDELRAQLAGCERVTAPAYAADKRGSAGFATALARSWASPLPVDLWRWRVPDVQRAAADQLAPGDVDVCIGDFLSAMPNLPRRVQAPVVLFQHNVEHVIWRRLAGTVPSWQRPLVEVEWRKLRRYERSACEDATLTIAVSEADRELLASLAPRATVRATPTGVDTDYFAPRERSGGEAGIAFVGSMDWYPNEDAALHLIDSILPEVRRELPGVEATIVGRNPSDRVRAAAAAAGVRVTGTVDDVRPYIAEAAVLVVPLRAAGGTRLKIYEALAMGKAVVSTSVGAEGLPLEDGRHYLRVDDASGFAGAVVSLLREPARRAALGDAGRTLVVERFSWPQVTQEFELRCREAIEGAVA